MTTTTAPTVETPSAEAMKMSHVIEMVRALMGGTHTMRLAGQKYLPQWPNEDPETYATRLGVSTLFPAYSRTVMTLAGKPFSKPITYGDNVPEDIKGWMEDDCDMQGRNLDAFAHGVLNSALAYGVTGILVDYPKVEAGSVINRAQELEYGLRPYLVHIEWWNVIGWKSQRINGVERLTQLRLREWVTEPEGPYNETLVEQIRVLAPGAWETHRKDAKGEWQLFENGTTSINFIPFVPVYGKRTDFMQGEPPMKEMAFLNVKHWQSQSDQDNILHVARVPILTVSGVEADDTFKMTIGASAAVKLPLGATAGFVEHSGSAIGTGRQALEDLKEEMRQAGAELLVLQPGQITATQVASENAVGMCVLQQIVQSAEDALDLALEYVAKWVGQPEGGNVTLFNDFGAATLAEASAQILVGMRQSGDLSKLTLLNEMKRRGILSAEVDPKEEIAAAAADGPELGTMTTPDNGGAGGGSFGQ